MVFGALLVFPATGSADVASAVDQPAAVESAVDSSVAPEAASYAADETSIETGASSDDATGVTDSTGGGSSGGTGSTGGGSSGDTGSTGGTGSTGSTGGGSTGATGPTGAGEGSGNLTPIAPGAPSTQQPESGSAPADSNPGTVTDNPIPGDAGPAIGDQTPGGKDNSGKRRSSGKSDSLSAGADDLAARTNATLALLNSDAAKPSNSTGTNSGKKNAGPAGVRAGLVITRIVEYVPAWMRWALALLVFLLAIAGTMLLREMRRRRLAEEDAMFDALTGISNRKAFERRLDFEWRRAERYGRSLGLLLIDLDGFKQVNDVKGHAAGDQVLREVAERLDQRMRDTDMVARIGGDEFAVVCPETKACDLEGIRGQLAEFATQGLTDSVGLSIGVAEFDASDKSMDDLIERADAAMYRVKRATAAAAAAAA